MLDIQKSVVYNGGQQGAAEQPERKKMFEATEQKWPTITAFLPNTEPKEFVPDLSIYDKFIVFFSGGKDSQACALHLLDLGVPAEKIELHHHSIDGREGSNLMDWAVTEDYCQAFADAFGMELYFSWKVGGFEGEMLRENALTAPTKVQDENRKLIQLGGLKGKPSTRRMFPQVTANLSQRWCSAYLKIDVGAKVMTAQERFKTGKYLVLTGERAEESSARAKYKEFEPYRADSRNGKRVKRYIDQWRAVHTWDEARVWEIIERYKVKPHPAYQLGFGRTSCMSCIFGNKDQWTSIQQIAPEAFEKIAGYEEEFGKTIHRSKSVRELAAEGTPYDMDPEIVKVAMSHKYNQTIITDDWVQPSGAFKECGGPQ